MRNSVFIISCFIKSFEQIDLLHNLCKKIKDQGREFIITSHSKIPEHIESLSRATFFDSNNHLIPVEGRDLSKRGKFWISTDWFVIESPFFLHGGTPCYSQAHLDLVYNGLVAARRLGYSCGHFLTYDSVYEIDEIEERETRIISGEVDFIGFSRESRILADNWSISLDRLNLDELFVTSETMGRRLEDLIYDDTKYLEKYLLNSITTDITSHEWGDPKIGSYVSPLKGKKTEWALFWNQGVNLFVQNTSTEDVKLKVITDERMITEELPAQTYKLVKIYPEGTYGMLLFGFDSDPLREIDLNLEDQRTFWVDSTTFQKF